MYNDGTLKSRASNRVVLPSVAGRDHEFHIFTSFDAIWTMAVIGLSFRSNEQNTFIVLRAVLGLMDGDNAKEQNKNDGTQARCRVETPPGSVQSRLSSASKTTSSAA